MSCVLFIDASTEKLLEIQKYLSKYKQVDVVLYDVYNYRGAYKYIYEQFGDKVNVYFTGGSLTRNTTESHLEQETNIYWKPGTFKFENLSLYDETYVLVSENEILNLIIKKFR